MKIISIGDIEILDDNERLFILNGWNIEIYNNKKYNVPTISREIDKNELESIEKQYFREKKLVRILKDDIQQLIKK